eukprot:scaffold45440_cov248-Skeletonema_marinoi.AAC.1
MSASSSIELQQPLGEDVGTTTQQMMRLGSEATTPRTNLTTSKNLTTQSNDDSPRSNSNGVGDGVGDGV